MKIFIIFLTAAFIVSCQNNPNESSPQPVNPSQNEAQENTARDLQIRVCNFNRNITICEISDWSQLRLKKMTETSQNSVPEKILDLLSLRNTYHLNETQIQCLKKNFCTEAF